MKETYVTENELHSRGALHPVTSNLKHTNPCHVNASSATDRAVVGSDRTFSTLVFLSEFPLNAFTAPLLSRT